MEIRAVYDVELEGRAEVFAESVTGSLEREGVFSPEEATAWAARTLGADYPRQELDLPVERIEIFRQGGEDARARVYRIAPAAGSSPAVLGFFARYPTLTESLASGDFALAALLIQRSHKLAPFSYLARYAVGDRAALAFALYWLGEFDAGKEAELDRLLSGSLHDDSRYDLAFDMAAPFIRASTAAEYRKEAADTVLATLERGQHIVLPVVGTGFHPGADSLGSLITQARDEARVRSILDGRPAQEGSNRLRRFVDDVEVSVRPEPYNRADRNALAVLFRHSKESRPEQAGYIRRDVARFLAPATAQGLELEARIHRLTESDTEIQIHARRDFHAGNGDRGV